MTFMLTAPFSESLEYFFVKVLINSFSVITNDNFKHFTILYSCYFYCAKFWCELNCILN